MMFFNKTPVLPEFIQPPNFDPRFDCPVSFIQKYDRITDKNGWSHAFKIKYLNCYLENAALVWFKKYVNNKDNFNKNWQDLKTDFIKQFGGENPFRKLKSKFRTRIQGENEDIKYYYYDLLSIAYEIDSEVNFDFFREQFENGLHESYNKYYYLLVTENMNFESLKNIVHKLNDLKDIFLESQMSAFSRNDYYCHNYIRNEKQPKRINSDFRNRWSVNDSYNGNFNKKFDNLKGRTNFRKTNNSYGSYKNHAGHLKYTKSMKSSNNNKNYNNSKVKHNHIIKYGQQHALPCENHIDQVENTLTISEEDYIANKDNYATVHVEDEWESPLKEIKCDENVYTIVEAHLQVEDARSALHSQIESTQLEDNMNALKIEDNRIPRTKCTDRKGHDRLKDMISRQRNAKEPEDIIIYPSHPPWAHELSQILY